MSDQKHPTVSISNLAKAANAAVKIAIERHKVQFAPDFRIGPGLIMGRELELLLDIQVQQVQQIATEIAQHVGSAAGGAATGSAAGDPAIGGQHLDPACWCPGHGPIICGFVLDPRVEVRE